MSKINVNQETCIGCGSCTVLASDHFEMRDDGKAHAKKEDVSEGETEAVKSAVDGCPVQAITLE